MNHLDPLLLHLGWHVARHLDAVMLSLWWILPTASATAFLLLQMTGGSRGRLSAAFVSFGLAPFLVLLCVAFATPFAARSYSIGGLLLALIYVLAWVGFFHTMAVALSVIWGLQEPAHSRSRILLVLIALQACGAWWVRDVAHASHSGPFFQSGG
jgi:hypothetical protein